MRRKRRRKTGAASHERWLVSYADFITLLFAFFTSMYAISSVNEAKYKSFSGSLSTAFNSTVNGDVTSGARMGPGTDSPMEPVSLRFQERFSTRYRSLAEAVNGVSGRYGVRLVMDNDRMIIRMPGEALFRPARASLAPKARDLLEGIAPALKALKSEIRIEGHTDNVPINNRRFRSNWDLSTARALSVLKFFINEFDFDPRLVSATGYGEFRPIATNDTPEGRRKNRRVDIVIER